MTSRPDSASRRQPGSGRAFSDKREELLSRWKYYISSIPTLLLRIRQWPLVLAVFLGLPVRRPFTIKLETGCRFKVRTAMDIWIIKETCLDRDYERDAVEIENGWTVLDIGAGFGDFAICVARRKPDCAVLAFEPLPESFAMLKENLALNRVANVRPFSQALAGRAGTLFLYTTTGLSGQHRTALQDAEAGGSAIPVEAITLEQAFDQFSIERCDFLKMDCEGAEYEILFAASKAALSRIGHIAMEYHDGVTPHTHEDLVQFLEGHGFRVRTRPNPAHRELGFLYASNQQAISAR